MSPSKQINEYARGWSELMKLVRQGTSWSGSESNRFFLNASGQFHEMSGLGGLDHPDDGRGVAIVDWNQDGKLDLWYRNRTAPRLRLMMNRRELGPSLAIRLQGTTANRDGIGAVVELLPKSPSPLVRSVQAGNLFLSQSSKWIHFGTDGSPEVTGADVLWPGGKRERFSHLHNKGRFILKQGTGKALPWIASQPRKDSALKNEAPIPVANRDDGIARIILPSRIPIPSLTFRDMAMRTQRLQVDGRARLLVLWSRDCLLCKKKLRAIAQEAATIRSAQLDVLALSVAGINGLTADTSSSYDLIDETDFPFEWGFIDTASVEKLYQFQTALFDRTPASTVPLALLLDQGANCVAIYRGTSEIKTVLEDWNRIRTANEKQLYHLAPPLKGTWFTNPLGRNEAIRLVRAAMASDQ